MPDQQDFESRLTAALQRRADAAPIEVDAYAVTRAAATARPSMGARLFGVPGWRTTRLVLAVVLLALVVAASLIIGGSLVSPAPTVDLGRLVPAGEMTTARGGPTATLLKDGHVLLVGGQVLAGDQSSAELYDPVTDSFAPTGSISTLDRMSAGAALLPDGRVLIVGGSGQLSGDADPIAFPFAEIYDPTTATFGRTGSMIQPRRWLWSMVTLPDGRVLIAGSEGDGGTYDSVELFDPSSDTFVDGGTLLAPRTQHTMTVLGDGRVLIAGGWSTDGPVATAKIYDPNTRTSVPTGDLLEVRAGHTASTLADGRVLIVGGSGPGANHGEASASAELFDPETSTFAPTGSMTTERSGARSVTLRDGRVLVAGGTNVDGDPRTIELYDPASGRFDVAGSLAPAQASGNSGWLSATLLDDGSVLLAGRDITSTERFIPTMPAGSTDDAAEPVSPAGFVAVDGPGVLRTGHTATRLADGRVLIAGGKLGGKGVPLASAEIFDPASGRLGVTGGMTAPRSGHVAALLPDGRVLIAGGLDEADAAMSWSSAELYDPEIGTFTPLGTMTIAEAPARDDRAVPYQAPTVATSLADDRVLIVGWDPTRGTSTRSMQVYDPATGNLTPVALPPGALIRGAQRIVPLPDGRVLVLDGNSEVLQAEVYDPVTGAWQLGAVTTGREAFASAVLPDGQVLLAGGKVGTSSFNDESLATAETWDPVGDTFSPADSMMAGRTGGSATILPDGRVLISGGHDHRHTPEGLGLPNVYPPPELWDAVSRSFGPAGVMVAERSGHTATPLDDGRVLIAGGVTRLPDRDVADPPAAELYVGPRP